ncbi:unnamed protein product, partial [Iphiclides podalirius]
MCRTHPKLNNNLLERAEAGGGGIVRQIAANWEQTQSQLHYRAPASDWSTRLVPPPPSPSSSQRRRRNEIMHSVNKSLCTPSQSATYLSCQRRGLMETLTVRVTAPRAAPERRCSINWRPERSFPRSGVRGSQLVPCDPDSAMNYSTKFPFVLSYDSPRKIG